MSKIIQVDDGKVVASLGRFRLSLEQNEGLMNQIGASQLLSVRRTFRGGGSPDGSWVPLSPNTIKSNPKIYGRGHKLLVRSGRLLNSIQYQAKPGTVTIGTNLRYAAVHQFGSRDRSTAVGPKTLAESSATVGVKGHGYFRLSGELGVGHQPGRGIRRIAGPRNRALVIVKSHQRHQNIPPRPYVVFRPEDPTRIRGIVQRFVAKARADAGLQSGQGGGQ